MDIHEILKKTNSGEILSHKGLVYLLGPAPDSIES